MSWRNWVVMGAAVLLLTACASATPEQKEALTAVLTEMVRDGKITQDQANSALALLTGAQPWWRVALDVLGAIAGAGVAVFGTVMGAKGASVLGRGLKTASTMPAPPPKKL